jgi:uncharacterized membrane protein
MTDAIPFWFHIVAVTVWVGPQVFLFAVTMPALRTIEDPHLRLRVVRIVARRFGWLAWAAMAVIVLSGISNLYDRILDDKLDVFNFDLRYAWIFVAKMALVGLTVGLTAVHSFLIGPRLIRLQEAATSGDPSQAAALRRASALVSALGLLGSLGAIFAATLLADHRFAFQPV